MFDDIERSFPPIDEGGMNVKQRALVVSLPDDYQRFLKLHNGGFVREHRYTFRTGVPYKTEKIDIPSRDDCVVEFFGIRTAPADGHHPACLIQTAEEHRAAQFLPREVIAIARCSQNSLVCISLSPTSHGAIYYWDYYWRYPWCSDFFEERVEQARSRFKDAENIQRNPRHLEFQALLDALNLATLVKLSDTLSGWCHSCFDATSDDEHE